LSLRLILAWLHLAALAIGVGGVWSRARALHDSLREPEDPGALRRALIGDAWWGVAAALWIVTGVWRLLGATEKSTGYYLGNHSFLAKMGLFAVVAALEIWPMKTLLRWRFHKAQPNPRDVGRIEIISYVQCVLVLTMVFFAVAMTRGYGAPRAAETALVQDSLSALGDVPDSAAVPMPAGQAIAHSAVAPSGSDVASAEDLALLTREIAMPIAGIDPSTLPSSFNDMRGGTRHHEALDIMAPRRTPVLSAADGRVLKLFTSRAGGLMIYAADSSERFILMYGHLDSYAAGLRDGSTLKRGQVIGAVGFTGNAVASAPHLHFALARSADVRQWSKGTPIDPLPILRAAGR
jgi:peptidoglycan LD-endopeptidase LytH